MYSNRLYKKYQQNWNYWYGMPENYWKQQVNTMVSSVYARTFPMNYGTETMYSPKQDFQYIRYPGLDGLHVPRFGVRKALNSGYSLNNNVAHFGNVRSLPFKMRAIFVPSYSLPLQQPCAGPLAMPPFVFNRMPQPLCSLPLPPPLPEVALSYLENYGQQMFMPQYINQVPVSPCTPNWQTYQPTASNCPQQSIMPISSFHSYQPVLIPKSMPMLPLQIPSLRVNYSQNIQYYNNGYPSICRACIPPPPPPSFNNSVINNSSIQYCPICHPISGISPNFNIRSANEQTRLLTRPVSVLPNLRNQTRSEKPYPYRASRLRKTPPLPPGAIIISDEYITKNELLQEHRKSQIHRKQRRPNNQTVKRIITPKTNNTDRTESNKNPSLSKVTITDSGAGSRQSLLKIKSTASSRSTYGLSFNESTNDEKSIITSNTTNQTIDHEQRPPGVPNIHIHSDDQSRSLSTAPDTDRRLDSSNSDKLRDLRLSLAIGDNQIDQISTVHGSSIKDDNEEEQSEEKTKKSIRATSSTPATSKTSETQLSTIGATTGASSSIIKTTSYGTLSSTRDKNFDTISTITTLKTDERSERNLSTIESL